MNRFIQQTAIITGGAQGLGFAIAQRLAGEGAKVWLVDTNEKLLKNAVEQITLAGGVAAHLVLDITSESSVSRGFTQVIAIDEKIDIVINSAGIVGPNGIKAESVEFDLFNHTINVNLNGAFLITKHALKAMVPNKYGRILLIASIAGKEGNAGMCAYSASKAGVIALVKATGKEYAESGITINALAPATIMTSMVAAMDPGQIEYMTSKIPMKRCGELNEAASLTAWIVSAEASFNTGFTFDLSGGRAVY
jgi:NAD(P)-dependent dehydrogenase (short-subunit alcohol dehydrogenase family)